jgi:hypothetical protein
MKKCLGIIVLLLIIESASFAKEISYGLKGGLNYGSSTYTTSTLINVNIEPKNEIGYSIGGFIDIPLGDKFSVQTELMYALHNNTISITSSNSTVSPNMSLAINGNINFSTLDMPILFKYQINDSFDVFMGPYFSLILSGKSKSEMTTVIGDTSTTNTTSETDIKNDTEDSDYGLVLGGSYKITPNLVFDGRYVLGLRDLLKIDNIELKQYYFTCSLGYKF